uniref:TSA: Wollemia nobilis Ref_Wollemi_Transcript_9408_1861 transcribed RNA sequence n=1 Tax=Wollemia nobilis TaxID=56998 RepID=A0A0C9S7A2_9CONI
MDNIDITNFVPFRLDGFLLLLLLLLLFSLLGRGSTKRLPPGPPAWPVVGHLHLLEKNRPLHQTLHRLAQRYGPIMFLRLGSRPTLVVTSSSLARECLATNDRIFASRPHLSAAERLGYNCTLLGLDPYDRRCRNLRRICASEVLSPSRVQALSHVRSQEVSKLVRSLYDKTLRNNQAVVDVTLSLLDMAFNVIVGMITRHDYLGNPQEVREFKEMIRDNSLLLASFNLGDFFPWLKWLEFLQGNQREMRNLSGRRDEILQKLIENHRKAESERKGNSNLIDTLLSLVDRGEDYCDNDSIVKATIMSLINAATDTTATTLEWAMASLLNRPDICRKAQEEVDVIVGRDRVVELSDLPKLSYLEAIIKETLRLYPAGPLLLPHMSTEHCTVGGFEIPVGTRLLVNVWAIQRDPGAWERPLEFEPERFLENRHLYPVDAKGVEDFKFIPFGCGRRACLGIWLAMSALQLTVGRLLQSFDWSVPDENGDGVDMTEGLAITLGRAVPLKAIVKPRLLPHLY